jgi:signal transduction histidine kinase
MAAAAPSLAHSQLPASTAIVARARRAHIGRQEYLLYSCWSTCIAWRDGRFGFTVQRRSLHLLDAAVPLIVGAVITLGGVLHSSASVRPLALAVGLAAAASLLARRRAPGWTLVVSGGLALIQFHIDPAAAATTVVAPAVALYSLALTRARTQRLLAALAAVAAVVIAEAFHAGGPTLLQTLGHVLLIAIPLLAAEAHRTRHAYVSLLRERLELAERTREQEAEQRAGQERMRIARDLHDVVAHTLTTINVQAATAAELLDRNPGHARAALETIEDASREAIGELRAILGVLRDGNASEPAFAPAPGVDTVAELVKRTCEGGLDVQLEVAGERPERLSDAVSLAAFRIVQESITNARRHAAGAPVRVSLSFEPGCLAVTVENRAGRPVNGNGTGPGVGIMGMTERAAALGGTLRAVPIGDGFRVDAELPYAHAAE